MKENNQHPFKNKMGRKGIPISRVESAEKLTRLNIWKNVL